MKTSKFKVILSSIVLSLCLILSAVPVLADDYSKPLTIPEEGQTFNIAYISETLINLTSPSGKQYSLWDIAAYGETDGVSVTVDVEKGTALVVFSEASEDGFWYMTANNVFSITEVEPKTEPPTTEESVTTEETSEENTTAESESTTTESESTSEEKTTAESESTSEEKTTKETESESTSEEKTSETDTSEDSSSTAESESSGDTETTVEPETTAPAQTVNYDKIITFTKFGAIIIGALIGIFALMKIFKKSKKIQKDKKDKQNPNTQNNKAEDKDSQESVKAKDKEDSQRVDDNVANNDNTDPKPADNNNNDYDDYDDSEKANKVSDELEKIRASANKVWAETAARLEEKKIENTISTDNEKKEPVKITQEDIDNDDSIETFSSLEDEDEEISESRWDFLFDDEDE